MSIELFNQLEQQVSNAVEAIEMLKMEAEELREENTRLKQEHDEWEQRLSGLLTKFQALDTGDSSDTNAS
ncbi:cell division protein ZapB [Onishia taeanensis]|uniref:Cell division protein ZapB n=1 Tax=Onishia taeanensis TaxID=284577 RepID=A0A328XYZ4_9GAMM|nr:cell division protein ZapB [Halomonas taeanensis]RAR63645.1 cell division protein ZapB [Halomonas taeanensis]